MMGLFSSREPSSSMNLSSQTKIPLFSSGLESGKLLLTALTQLPEQEMIQCLFPALSDTHELDRWL